MATKGGGGSLLGKADSTLASMSYREAMADVMPDYSGIYEAEAVGFEKKQLGFQKAVSDYFDIQHADNNKLADELKEATTKAMEGLGTDYEGMELFDSYLTSMKDKAKALPKNKKGNFERSKIRAEMNQLLESSNALSDTLAKVGTMIKAGDFNVHTTDYPILNAINNKTATKKIVDGNLVYSFTDDDGNKQTIDRQGIKDALGQSDLEMDSNFIKQGAASFELGKIGEKFNRNKSINSYENMFTSPAGLAANMNEKQNGLDYTFVEALAGKDGSKSIYDALTNMGQTTIDKFDVSGPKGEKDGKITEADFASSENGIALIESLTKPRSKNYNFQAAKRAAAEFYADNVDQVEHTAGGALRPRDPNTVNNDPDKPLFNSNMYYPLGTQGGSVTGGQINGWVDSIKAGREFDFEGNTYSHIDGGWYLNYNDGSKEGEKKSTPDSDNHIGSANDLIFNAFGDGGNDARFNNITTEKIKIIDHKTGEVQGGGDEPKKPEASVAEDFMKEETKFMENIQEKYDFSNYIIQERQFEILPGEVWGNQIRIIDRNDPSKYKDFRTNYSQAGNAQKAAIKWDKWIVDNKIKLKSKGKYD